MEQLEQAINDKLKEVDIIVKYVNDNKNSVMEARKNKTLTLEAYRVSVASMALDGLKFQLSALFNLKKALGEVVDEKYKNIMAMSTAYLEINGEELKFKGEDTVKDIIENGMKQPKPEVKNEVN